MSEDVTLPCIAEVVFAQHAVYLYIASGMVDGEDKMRAEVVNESGYIEVAVCCGAGVEY